MRVALSLFSFDDSSDFLLSLFTGRFTRLCEGDMVEMNVGTRLMVFGKDALADLTCLINETLRQQDDYLTKLHIGTLSY